MTLTRLIKSKTTIICFFFLTYFVQEFQKIDDIFQDFLVHLNETRSLLAKVQEEISDGVIQEIR